MNFNIQSADYDCAIVVDLCYPALMRIYFARVPDPEIANTVFALSNRPSIEVCESNGLIVYGTPETSPLFSKERERILYTLSIPPLYDAATIARRLARTLSSEHGLSVNLTFVDPPQNQRSEVIPSNV